MNNIKGSGLFLLEKYKGVIVVVLFGIKNFQYDDLGGTIDKNEHYTHTAYREVREESANLLNIKPKELLLYANQVKLKYYLSFILYVENISFRDYMFNVNIIRNKCKDRKYRCWKETNHMVRIPLVNLLKSMKTNTDYAMDINGKLVRVRGRVFSILKHGYEQIKDILKKQPKKMVRRIVTKSRHNCLLGSITYTMT